VNGGESRGEERSTKVISRRQPVLGGQLITVHCSLIPSDLRGGSCQNCWVELHLSRGGKGGLRDRGAAKNGGSKENQNCWGIQSAGLAKKAAPQSVDYKKDPEKPRNRSSLLGEGGGQGGSKRSSGSRNDLTKGGWGAVEEKVRQPPRVALKA